MESRSSDVPESVAGAEAPRIPLYELHKAQNVDYVYTTAQDEVEKLVGAGYVRKGVTARDHRSQEPGTEPLHRLYKGSRTDHVLASTSDAVAALERRGYISQGIVGYVDSEQTPGTVPLYRLWNEQRQAHFHTADPRKRDAYVMNRRGYTVHSRVGDVEAGDGH